MTRQIPEKDWKIFKKVHTIALERYSSRALEEISEIQSLEGLTAHERFLKLYELTQSCGEEMAEVFDDYRRSTAWFQLARMKSIGLLEQEDLLQFSEEPRQVLDFLG